MNYLFIFWDDPNDPRGNIEHIAEHGLTIADVEEVLKNPYREGKCKSSGCPCCWGYTGEGLYLQVVYEIIDEDTIRVITAYEVLPPDA